MTRDDAPSRKDFPRVDARKVSIRDIARHAGVSVTTVSHALSGKRYVAPETAQRIRALVPALGYVPYAAARSLQSGKTLVIGLVVPDISNQFFGEIAMGVETYANEQDYGVILCTSQVDARREKRYFNLLRNRSIDGLIYNAGDAVWDDEFPRIAEQWPVVIVDEHVPGIDNRPVVASDHLQGGRLVGEHLLALGHEHVAIITGPLGLRSTEERLEGFQRSYQDAVIVNGDYSERGGRAATAQIVHNHPAVTAIFTSNDVMAFGAMAELTSHGIRIPGDMSVVGFDDVDFASRITPALTTVRQPGFEIGRRAAQLLLSHLIHGEPFGPIDVTLPVRLIARASSSTPRPSIANS